MTEWALILVLAGVCAGLIASGLLRRGGIYEYPFLAGVTFLGFVLPQLPALAEDTHLPEGATARAVAFTILCAGACWVGWSAGQRRRAGLPWTLDRPAAVLAAAMLTAAGAVFYYKMSMLPKELTEATQLTGLPVAYLFFAKLLSYGLYLSVLCILRWRSRAAVAIASVGAALLLYRIVGLGRRGEAAEFLLVLTLSLWFVRGVAVPRALALVGVLLAMLALTGSAAEYRTAAAGKGGQTWSDVAKIDFVGNFMALVRDGGPELRNAVQRIDDADRLSAYDFGLFHWNVLVFNFVPAQVVGADFKRALLAPLPQQSGREYNPPTGTTETGMADAFASFWYLGCLKFFLIAYALGRLYSSARQGSIAGQLLYMASVVPAMLAITHHTQWMLSTWVHMALLLLPILMLARALGSAGPAARPFRQYQPIL